MEPLLAAVERCLGLRCDGVRSQLIAELLRETMAGAGEEDAARYTRRLARDAVERERLAEALRVPETYFLRDEEQLRVIAEDLLPTLVRRVRRPLRIWSAGCASGEEAYSLAILLETAGLAGRAGILGTDRSVPAIEAAEAGRYRPWSLRGLDEDERARYFTATSDGDEVVIADRLRAAVTFARHDLLADPYRSGFDLIVCRNVLLYLTADRGREVVERFATALAPGGWLVLGAADPHHTASDVLELVRTPAGAVYRRLPDRPRPPEPPAACRASTRPRRAPSRRPAPGGRPPTGPPPVEPVAVGDEAELPNTLEGCVEEVRRRPLDAHLHVRHARLLLEAGRAVAALEAARRALFLAPELAAGHLVLGRAALGVQDPARAAVAFEQAADLLTSQGAAATDQDLARLLEVARAGARRSAERGSR